MWKRFETLPSSLWHLQHSTFSIIHSPRSQGHGRDQVDESCWVPGCLLLSRAREHVRRYDERLGGSDPYHGHDRTCIVSMDQCPANTDMGDPKAVDIKASVARA